MKIYNTLTKQKEVFKPIEPNKIKMYVCGPTVYNFIHIGNARPYIVFDTVRRFFEAIGYDVTYVQNFTDVDDKIINRAKEENKTTTEVVEYYIQETLTDAKNLNVKPASFHPRVTEEIEPIIDMIKTLVDKGFAYEVEGTVYFNTPKFNDYGKLSKKVLEELEIGSRIEVAEQKQSPLDFVLWKPKKDGEPYWESPWSNGRPGWHIECSAMSKVYLGETIDIHAGGEDLVFPHHENEIAQSEACNGVPFANYWIHNSFLNIDNKKMSKSLGNFKTAREVGEAFGYDVLRVFMLSAHYRSPINFTPEAMEAAKNGLERIKNGLDSLKFALDNCKESSDSQSATQLQEIEKLNNSFFEAMSDDFNTADALSYIFELIKFSNICTKKETSKDVLEKLYSTLTNLTEILGIIYEQPKKEIGGLSDEEILDYISQRTAAKKAKDFAKADEIRNFLLNSGVEIKDTREGVHFKRV
ncbi:MAG: cysteine--tRNA ligase [Epulopiscium sp. Nele67-Bin005]|nr:MAG: cysteine--tRNA ligase [Epulopiscium sp. Nele67-Bin005]